MALSDKSSSGPSMEPLTPSIDRLSSFANASLRRLSKKPMESEVLGVRVRVRVLVIG